MAEFTLRDPETEETYIVGNASEKARLVARGYEVVEDEGKTKSHRKPRERKPAEADKPDSDTPPPVINGNPSETQG